MLNKWESLANEPAILDAVKHCHIEFYAVYPVQNIFTGPEQITFSASEKEVRYRKRAY